jgi:hypothetical protein
MAEPSHIRDLGPGLDDQRLTPMLFEGCRKLTNQYCWLHASCAGHRSTHTCSADSRERSLEHTMQRQHWSKSRGSCSSFAMARAWYCGVSIRWTGSRIQNIEAIDRSLRDAPHTRGKTPGHVSIRGVSTYSRGRRIDIRVYWYIWPYHPVILYRCWHSQDIIVAVLLCTPKYTPYCGGDLFDNHLLGLRITVLTDQMFEIPLSIGTFNTSLGRNFDQIHGFLLCWRYDTTFFARTI